MRILIVDDSATIRRILVKMLNQLGYDDLVVASNGEDATGKMDGVDLIITDWHMPEMDGIGFVKWVRAHEQYVKVPIIMITIEGTREGLMEAVQAGVNQYIRKPFTSEVVRAKVEALTA